MLGLALKNITRHRLRSLLTILGVAAGMFLYAAVETTQSSLSAATRQGAGDTTLVVYRENRFCPLTSRLPEHYLSEIRRIEGVREAIPIQIVSSTSGARARTSSADKSRKPAYFSGRVPKITRWTIQSR